MTDKDFRIKVELEGLDTLSSKIAKAVQDALNSVKIPELKMPVGALPINFAGGLSAMAALAAGGGRVAETPEAREKEDKGAKKSEAENPDRGILPVLSRIFEPFTSLLNRLTGGIAGGLGVGIGALVGGAKGAEEGGAAGGAAGGMGGGLVGGVLGPVLGILTSMAGALESLAPIKAVLTVIGAIFQLAMLPLAMVLMAILMPFLMPLLQLLGKLPWVAIFDTITKMEKDISTGLADIWNAILAVSKFIGKLDQDIAGGLEIIGQVFTDVFNGYIDLWKAGIGIIIEVAKDIWAGIQDLGQVFVDIFNAYIDIWKDGIGIIVTVAKDVWTGIQAIVNFFSQLNAWFSGVIVAAIKDIDSGITGAWNVLKDVWNWFMGTMQPVFQDIDAAVKAIQNFFGGASNAVSTAGSDISGFFSSIGLATGGAVVQQGLAYIHAGETVLPKGTVGIQGAVSAASTHSTTTNTPISVTVSGNMISSQVDETRLAQKVAKAISDQARRQRTW